MKTTLSLVVGLCTMLVPASGRHDGSYQSGDGMRVHGPYLVSHRISGEAAVCKDGARSLSRHHSGTCSSHGGVALWN